MRVPPLNSAQKVGIGTYKAKSLSNFVKAALIIGEIFIAIKENWKQRSKTPAKVSSDVIQSCSLVYVTHYQTVLFSAYKGYTIYAWPDIGIRGVVSYLLLLMAKPIARSQKPWNEQLYLTLLTSLSCLSFSEWEGMMRMRPVNHQTYPRALVCWSRNSYRHRPHLFSFHMQDHLFMLDTVR